MKNKKKEINCLTRAIEAGKHQTGLTKRLLELLDNPDISDNPTESPDFIKICKPCALCTEEFIMGIEHFEVDYLCKLNQKSNKPINKTSIQKKQEEDLYNLGHSQIIDLDLPVNTIYKELSNVMSEGLNIAINAKYDNYIESFSHSVNKHNAKVNRYIKRLKDIALGRPYKIAYLIEIQPAINEFVLWNGKRYLEVNNSVPITWEVIEIINSIKQFKVDYVYLVINKPLNANSTVIPIDMKKDIVKQFKKLHYYPCEFVDCPSFEKGTVEIKDNESDKLKFDLTVKGEVPEFKRDDIVNLSRAIKVLYEYEIEEIPYMTKETIYNAYERFKPYIIGWGKLDNEDNEQLRIVLNDEGLRMVKNDLKL